MSKSVSKLWSLGTKARKLVKAARRFGRQLPPALVGPLNRPAYLSHFMQEAPTVTLRPLAARASRPEVLCNGSILA